MSFTAKPAAMLQSLDFQVKPAQHFLNLASMDNTHHEL